MSFQAAIRALQPVLTTIDEMSQSIWGAYHDVKANGQSTKSIAKDWDIARATVRSIRGEGAQECLSFGAQL